jgi:hypothetical protein
MPVEISSYPEIDGSPLVEAGILDVIRNPINGADHHPNIPWGRVTDVVIHASYFDEAGVKTPRHHLIVNFKNRAHHKPAPFVIGQQEDGNFSIATVSGTSAGLAELNNDQSTIMAELLMKSLSKTALEAD